MRAATRMIALALAPACLAAGVRPAAAADVTQIPAYGARPGR